VCEVADEGRAEATGDDAGHGEPRHTLSTTPSRRDRSLDCDTDREKEVARVDRCDVSGIPQTQASVLCVSTHWPMRQE
jgi:hypothetical protein